ncbi:hypothetical protein PtB15_7B168 [Puccinia triticina]|nr:hypothetical protein PtB15_7B168 [Puccinia triticina]
MVKEMAQIIRGKNGDFEHYLDYHPQCFCHVLAFILGAGLKSIKLQKQFQDPSSTTKPDFFPMLDTIEELDKDAAEDKQSVEGTDEIQEVDKCDDCGEVDPDDASIGSDWDLSNVDQGQACMEGSIVDGFGHTLVKNASESLAEDEPAASGGLRQLTDKEELRE